MNTKSDVYYRHLRKRNLPFINREATIAAVVTEDNEVRVGISICNNSEHRIIKRDKNDKPYTKVIKDQFSKVAGRDIAEERANFNPYLKFPAPPGLSEAEACRLGIQNMTGIYLSREGSVIEKLTQLKQESLDTGIGLSPTSTGIHSQVPGITGNTYC